MALNNTVEICRFSHEDSLQAGLAKAQSMGALMLDAHTGVHAPHTLANQLAKQLDVMLPRNSVKPFSTMVHLGEQVDLIAQMVDLDTSGYRPVLRARELFGALRQPLAERLNKNARSTLVKLNEKADHADVLIWCVRDSQVSIAEEDYFFLYQLLSELPYRLFVYCLEAPSLPSHWTTATIQVDHAVIAMAGPGFVSPLVDEPWLSVTDLQGNSSPKNINSLMKHGLQAIDAGSYALGLHLLDRATQMSGSRPVTVTLRLLSDGLRIGLERYCEVVDLALPDVPLSARQRGQFLQYKAWALAMIGQADAAQTYFEEALQLMHCTPPSIEYLYLQNIYAMSLFRQGKRERAMQFERAIALSLRLQGAPSAHLIYLNSMNTAQFLLSMNQVDEAKEYFERAFATHEGLRSLGDHLMRHIYLGRIATRSGRHAIARRHYLRAALFWLASDMREALPIRVARLLLGRVLPDRLMWPAAFSQALQQLLHDSAIAAGIVESTLNVAVASTLPDFVYLPEHPGLVCETVMFTPDWTLAGSSIKVRRSSFESSDRQLAQTVWTLLLQGANASNFEGVNSLVVDDNLGVDMPDTTRKAAVLARRLGVRYQGSSFDSEGETENETDWVISLVPTAQLYWPRAGVCVVKFMRYRQPLELRGTAARVLGLLEVEQRKRVSELNIRLHTKVSAGLLDQLLELRLIRMERVFSLAYVQPALCA